MQTYSCTPKQQNKRALSALIVFCVLLALSTVLIIFSIGILLVNQSVFLICAAIAVWILTRHYFNSYTYTITLMNSEPTLLITQRQGRRVTTVFHHEISALTEMHENVRGESNPRFLHVDARYSYFVSLMPDRWQNLYFHLQDGQCISVMIECDEAFLKVLREALQYLQYSAPQTTPSEEE